MNTPILQGLHAQPNPLAHNRELRKVLEDHAQRARLYEELRALDYPALRFKSVLRKGDQKEWPCEDVYLLTRKEHVQKALQTGSVAPYAELDSGGRFMLGQEPSAKHQHQRDHAVRALELTPAQIQERIKEALKRTFVLPNKLESFDLVKDVAGQAALRLLALVFGMPARSHVLLERAMDATYTRLTFQIIGRHFAPDDGQPSPDSSQAARDARKELEEQVLLASQGKDFPEFWDRAFENDRTAAVLLGKAYASDQEMTRIVILGLMAGTVGNVKAAVANTIDYFFRTDDQESPLIDRAIVLSRQEDPRAVEPLVDQALLACPPAPFLARTAKAGFEIDALVDETKTRAVVVPAGAHLLLAMGADAPDLDLVFGGASEDFAHRCVGRRLAQPLIYATVREVLRLPGLARVIDRATDEPKPLVKRWGSMCLEFPLRWQRDRRLNQQPLFLVLPIKEPVQENAIKLELLTRAGAAVIERALEEAKNVHFAWFGIVENGTHLAMYTVYDGDFDAYVEHFALKVPLFDEQFKYLNKAPRTPVREYPKEFVKFIKDHNRSPVAGYFYSAYPPLGAADIRRLLEQSA